MAQQTIGNIESTLGSVRMQRTAPVAGRSGDAAGEPCAVLAASPARPRRAACCPSPVLHAVAFEATLILVTVLSIMLAGRDFARPEWDLEWLATLAVAASHIAAVPVDRTGVHERVRDARAASLPVGARMDLRLPLDGAAARDRLDAGAAVHRRHHPVAGRHRIAPVAVAAEAAEIFMRRFPSSACRCRSSPWPWSRPPMRSYSIGLPRCRTGRCGFRPAWRCERSPPRMACRRSRGAPSCWSRFSLVTAGLLLLQRQLRDGVVAAGAREAVMRGPRGARPDGLALARCRARAPVGRCSAGSCACSRATAPFWCRR